VGDFVPKAAGVVPEIFEPSGQRRTDRAPLDLTKLPQANDLGFGIHSLGQGMECIQVSLVAQSYHQRCNFDLDMAIMGDELTDVQVALAARARKSGVPQGFEDFVIHD
jgi:hypothetical protein